MRDSTGKPCAVCAGTPMLCDRNGYDDSGHIALRIKLPQPISSSNISRQLARSETLFYHQDRLTASVYAAVSIKCSWMGDTHISKQHVLNLQPH